jgi:methyl-accepting chemotaxis protein
MEIVYFTLGVFTVLSIIGVVIVVRMTIAVRQLQEDLRDHERGTHDVTVDLHRRIEDEVRELRFRNNETLLRIKDEVRDLQSQLDSRLSKLED